MELCSDTGLYQKFYSRIEVFYQIMKLKAANNKMLR